MSNKPTIKVSQIVPDIDLSSARLEVDGQKVRGVEGHGSSPPDDLIASVRKATPGRDLRVERLTETYIRMGEGSFWISCGLSRGGGDYLATAVDRYQCARGNGSGPSADLALEAAYGAYLAQAEEGGT